MATEGLIRQLTPGKLTIQTDDHRIVWYIVRDGILTASPSYALGDRVEVRSFSEGLAPYIASLVQRVSPPASPQPAISTAPPPSPEDAAITSARTATAKFVEELPSFQVHRRTARQEKRGRLARWQTLDEVTATLVYRNGSESYSDIRIGEEEVKESLNEIDGLHTTGEFGQLVVGILDAEKRAVFARPRPVELNGRNAWRYTFSISRERSKWRLTTPSEQYFTAYTGALWIDLETSRVLRVEMEARELPKAFPLDTVEMNVDYSFVKLDSGETFLLPSESEALNCVRGTNLCLKNATLFTDYVKFEAESKILFEDVK